MRNHNVIVIFFARTASAETGRPARHQIRISVYEAVIIIRPVSMK